uniref:Transmembrane protein n=1 Tax=Leersia perrieri TaxID=77586 RepID=A0A0D9X045_9ORYZ
MPRFLLFCLVSSQLAITAVMGRPFPVFFGGMAASIADAPSSSDSAAGDGHLHVYSFLESSFAESPLSSHHHNHSPFDRKFAGGKVILGGLAAAIFAAVFCYIRITRRKKTEPKS